MLTPLPPHFSNFFYFCYVPLLFQEFYSLNLLFQEFYKTLNACYFCISLPSPVCNNFLNKINFRLWNSSKSILLGTISSRTDAKLINGNGFLSDLANGLIFFFGLATSVFSFYHAVQNVLCQSLNLEFLWVQYLFCMAAIYLQNSCMMDLLS